jgi:hypothetical protein
VATTAVLLLLSEKPRYPKLGAYPKYGDFTLMLDYLQLLFKYRNCIDSNEILC